MVLDHEKQIHVPKDVRLNSTHYMIMKINNRKEFQNIGINHSADIDYKHFIKTYRECTKKPFNFLPIDTTLPSNNPLRFRKKLFNDSLKKMTVTDQINILNRKIKQNE